MPALPLATAFTDSAVTEGGFKSAITDLRGYLAFLLGEDGTKETAQLTLGAGFTSGTRMSFNQTSAPTGWTKDTTSALNDSVIRIVTGTVGSGGSTAFSTWNTSGVTGATTLSTSQLPSHSHIETGSGPGTTANRIQISSGASGSTTSTNSTAATGSGDSHTHPLSSNLKYRDFIIATKD